MSGLDRYMGVFRYEQWAKIALLRVQRTRWVGWQFDKNEFLLVKFYA